MILILAFIYLAVVIFLWIMAFRYFAKRDEKFMRKWRQEFREEIKGKVKEIERKTFPLLEETEESLKTAREEIETTQIRLEGFVTESIIRKVVGKEIKRAEPLIPIVLISSYSILSEYYGSFGKEKLPPIGKWTPAA